jgi:hypothetical protein
MSNNYGPRIVTDGLVLCLDAADRNSYPGSGTTWKDLSGVVGNATLNNSPSFQNSFFNFDGINDYAQTPSYSFSSVDGMTMEIIFKVSSSYTHSLYGRIIDWQDCTMSIGTYSSKQFRCWMYAGGTRNSGEFVVNSSSSGFWDNWHHAVMTYDQSYVKGYWDTVLTFNVGKTGSLASGSYPFTIGTGDSNYSGLDLAMLRVYNRALSANEVLQNYQATKGRFGL